MIGRELSSSSVSASIFAREGALDERGWATIWQGDRLPDATSTDGLDVFLLEVLKKDVLGAEEGGRGDREDDMLFPFGELLKDRLAWQTSPLDGVSVEINRM